MAEIIPQAPPGVACLRLAARSLVRSPGYSAAVLALLTLGFGTGAVGFLLMNAVLFRPLPVRAPEQLHRLVTVRPKVGRRGGLGYEVYRNLAKARSVTGVFASSEFIGGLRVGAGQPTRAAAGLVTGNYFEALGVQPLMGRLLGPHDGGASETPPAVLSFLVWQNRFGGDRRAIGKSIWLKGAAFTVAGVLPQGFSGTRLEGGFDLYLPLSAIRVLSPGPRADPAYLYYDIGCRLAPQATLAQASAEARAAYRSGIEAEMRRAPGIERARISAELSVPTELDPIEHGESRLREKYRGVLVFLMAVVGLLLALVAASVAGLLIARMAARRHEIGVRLALGATRSRVLFTLLPESLLLAGTAAGLALAFAAGSTPMLRFLLPPYRDLYGVLIDLNLNFTPDFRLLSALAGAWALVGFTCLLTSWVEVSRLSPQTALRAERATHRSPGRHAAIAVQAALATVLVICSGLLLTTFDNLKRSNPGFEPAGVATFSIDPQIKGYNSAQVQALVQHLKNRVRELPQVESAAVAGMGLLRGSGMLRSIAPTGEHGTRAGFLNTSTNAVSEDYFRVLRMRLITGRAFTPADASRHDPVPVVVNESFARRFFPGRDPLNQTFGVLNLTEAARPEFQVIGVVNDARYRTLRETALPTMYQPWDPDAWSGGFVLYVRSREDPARLAAPVERIRKEIDPDLSFYETQLLPEQVRSSLWSERVLSIVATLLGAIAVLVAATGIHGTIAYAAERRRREIGIRVALGAGRAHIFGLVCGRTLLVVAAGVITGAAGVVLLAPRFADLLYGVSPQDAAIMASGALLTMGLATASALAAAVSALRVQPAAALRQE